MSDSDRSKRSALALAFAALAAISPERASAQAPMLAASDLAKKVQAPPDQPSVERDLSIVFDEAVKWSEVEALVRHRSPLSAARASDASSPITTPSGLTWTSSSWRVGRFLPT